MSEQGEIETQVNDPFPLLSLLMGRNILQQEGGDPFPLLPRTVVNHFVDQIHETNLPLESQIRLRVMTSTRVIMIELGVIQTSESGEEVREPSLLFVFFREGESSILEQFLRGGGNKPKPPAGREVVAALPKCVAGPESSCVICLEDTAGTLVTSLPCGHKFHGECIETWLEDNNTCVTCRYELETDDETYNEELLRKRVATAQAKTEAERLDQVSCADKSKVESNIQRNPSYYQGLEEEKEDNDDENDGQEEYGMQGDVSPSFDSNKRNSENEEESECEERSDNEKEASEDGKRVQNDWDQRSYSEVGETEEELGDRMMGTNLLQRQKSEGFIRTATEVGNQAGQRERSDFVSEIESIEPKRRKKKSSFLRWISKKRRKSRELKKAKKARKEMEQEKRVMRSRSGTSPRRSFFSGLGRRQRSNTVPAPSQSSSASSSIALHALPS